MKKKGFTLVEVLVVSVMLFVIIDAVYFVFANSMKTASDEKNRVYIDSMAKSLMDQMQQSMQMAYQNTIACSDNSISMEVPSDNNYVSPGQGSRADLSFKMDRKAKSIKIIKNVLSEDNSSRIISDNALSGHVKKFETEKTENGFVTIMLTIDYDSKKDSDDKELSIYYKIRID